MTTALGGKPAHKPTSETRAQVQALSACGVREADIAAVVGISQPTLRKHYRDELDLGMIKANAKVAQTLFNKATSAGITGPSVTAAIFWMKTRAGWKETVVNEHMGKDGEPIQTEDVTSARDEISRRIAELSARARTSESPGTPH